MKIKLVERGWESYSGNFGTAVFENGEADVPLNEAMRIGSTLAVVDENNVPVSPAYEITRTKSMTAEVEAPRERGVEAEEAETAKEEAETAKEEAETEQKQSLTREELEKIADDKGIKGLREIAEPLGIRGTSISGLIEEILKA